MSIAANPDLDEALRAELARGPIPFRRFMELALYHPEGGYYRRPRPRTGPAGDFQTSPHQSPWFGRMVARQAVAVWESLGRTDGFTLVEYGPGEGWLARDILESIGESGPSGMAEALTYLLIEQSPHARGRIGERLAPWMEGEKPRARLAEAPPEGFDGLVLANEFLDALPVHAVIRAKDGLKERYVALEEERLTWREGELSDTRLGGWFENLGVALEEGQRAEVCLAAPEWAEGVAGRLGRGGVLVFDYGFSSRVLYDPARREGTLRGFRRHAVSADPLAEAGAFDLTADVDFSALLRAAEGAGLRLGGFTDQCHFLLGAGLAQALEGIADPGGEKARRERMAVMGLLDPGGLGGAIKAMILLDRWTLGADMSAFGAPPADRSSAATLRL